MQLNGDELSYLDFSLGHDFFMEFKPLLILITTLEEEHGVSAV